MDKKGQAMGLNILIGAVIALVLVGIVAVFGLDLLTDTQADFTANSVEYNATADAIEGVAKVPSKLPLLAGAIITVVIIALLVRYFQSGR